jgi:hypothetical protein
MSRKPAKSSAESAPRPIRAQHLALLRELLDEARAAGNHNAAAGFMRQIAEVAGVMVPPRRRKPAAVPSDAVEALRQRIASVQEMRAAAVERGTFSAAARLVEVERSLERELGALLAERGKAASMETEDADLLQRVAESILSWPPQMRRALFALVQAGETGPARGAATPS